MNPIMQTITEFMQFPLWLGVCGVLWRLYQKVDSIGTDVAALKERRRLIEEEKYCIPVHAHVREYHVLPHIPET